MIIICIIFLLLFFYLNKKTKRLKENEVSEEKIYTLTLLNKILLGFTILIFVITITGYTNSNTEYKEFKTNVNQVMLLNKPLVYKCKVSRNGHVKIYYNPIVYENLSLTEQISEGERIRNTIETIGYNTNFISNDDDLTFFYYEAGK